MFDLLAYAAEGGAAILILVVSAAGVVAVVRAAPALVVCRCGVVSERSPCANCSARGSFAGAASMADLVFCIRCKRPRDAHDNGECLDCLEDRVIALHRSGAVRVRPHTEYRVAVLAAREETCS